MRATIVPLFALFVIGITICGCATLRESPTQNATTLTVPSPGECIQSSTGGSSIQSNPINHSQGPVNRAQSSWEAVAVHRYDGGSRDLVDSQLRLASFVEYDLPVAERWQDSSTFSLDGLHDLQRLPPVESGEITFGEMFVEQWAGVRSDYVEFYSSRGLVWLAGGIGAGSLMANTGFDENFVRDAYVDSVVLAPNNEIYEKLHQPKFLGDGYYTIPLFALAAITEPLIGDIPLGSETAEWGQRSLRTILVGGPTMLGLQLLTGGGRPDETDESSEWRPFRDNNGVSGHAFMGAIPFISAAKMTDDIWLKGGLYVASTLPAISRINDDAHYFSQVFLGWWLAYLAESAVDRSFKTTSPRRWHIYPSNRGLGVMFSSQW